MTNDNVGKCGHAKCAGGNLCYYQGKPMTTYSPVCVKHDMEAPYSNNRCIKCMDEIPLDQLGAPDFGNKNNINL